MAAEHTVKTCLAIANGESCLLRMYLLLINLALVFRIESQLYNLIEIPERRISPNAIEGMQRNIKMWFSIC